MFCSFLAPSNEELPKALQRIDPEDPDSETKLVDIQKRYPLPETEALWHMGQSKEHRYLLKHPVITSFLWYKWQRIRKYFNRNLRFYMLFVFILTWYIFQNFGGKAITDPSSKTTSIPFFHGLYGFFALLMILFIVKDWKEDLKDIFRANSLQDKDEDADCKQLIGLVLTNWVEVGLITGLILILMIGAKSLYVTLIILTGILTMREILQMTVSLRRYLLSPENWIEIGTIICISIILFHKDDESDFNALKRHLSALAIVLSWAELITLVGKHPKLTR